MGDEIELSDVNGVKVTVPLYPALAAIGEKLEYGEIKCVARRDGRIVEVCLGERQEDKKMPSCVHGFEPKSCPYVACSATEDWEDVKDEWTDKIKAAYPTRSDSHEEYGIAMKMVSHRHSKGELVAPVNWLLVERKGWKQLYDRKSR